MSLYFLWLLQRTLRTVTNEIHFSSATFHVNYYLFATTTIPHYKQMQQQQRHHIPDELFQYIFSFSNLSVQHKCIALTCKRFFSMVQHEHAWQVLLASYYPLHFQYLQEITAPLLYKQEFAKVHRFCFDAQLMRKRDLKLKKRNKVVVGKSMLLAEKYRLVVSGMVNAQLVFNCRGGIFQW